MLIIGCDPGAKGAVAFFDVTAGGLTIIDMPTVQVKRGKSIKNELAPSILAQKIRDLVGQEMVQIVCVIEKVGAMPDQGVTSMFQFGRSVGILEGVIASRFIRIEYVTPQKWKKALGIRGGKDGGRARAAQLFPNFANLFARVKDNGRADAALIAYYWATKGAI